MYQNMTNDDFEKEILTENVYRYQVFETEALTEVQVKALEKLVYSFWKPPVVGGKAQMVVNPEDISAVQKLFKHYNIGHSVHIEDLKK